jgi:hypothetical protein
VLELVLAPGIYSSAPSLSWPHGSEFVDSSITFSLFELLSLSLSHDGQYLVQFLKDAPDSSLHGLGGLDYRKSLMANIMTEGPGLFSYAVVVSLSGLERVIGDTSFRSLESDHIEEFNPEVFLWVCSSKPSSGVFSYKFLPRLSRNSKTYRSSSAITSNFHLLPPPHLTRSHDEHQTARVGACIHSAMVRNQ